MPLANLRHSVFIPSQPVLGSLGTGIVRCQCEPTEFLADMAGPQSPRPAEHSEHSGEEKLHIRLVCTGLKSSELSRHAWILGSVCGRPLLPLISYGFYRAR